MRDDLFTAKFSTPETAAALEHGNFAEWRRNMTRGGFLGLPRITGSGRAGGDYGYAHIAEAALLLAVAGNSSREIGAGLAFGVLSRIKDRSMNAPAVLEAFNHLRTQAEEFDGAEGVRFDLVDLVIAPQLFFGENVISRDPKNRTWAVFIPSRIVHSSHAVRLVQERDADGGSLSVGEVRRIAHQIATAGASDERTIDHFEQYAYAPGLVDLTGIFLRFERHLAFRLDARTLGRRG